LGPLHSMRRLLSWLRIDRMHLSRAFQMTRRVTTSKSTTFDRIHHTTRESLWRKQGELPVTRRMRNEATIHASAGHKNTFMWQQCGLPPSPSREGLINIEMARYAVWSAARQWQGAQKIDRNRWWAPAAPAAGLACGRRRTAILTPFRGRNFSLRPINFEENNLFQEVHRAAASLLVATPSPP
jgi:hypothetical protein